MSNGTEGLRMIHPQNCEKCGKLSYIRLGTLCDSCYEDEVEKEKLGKPLWNEHPSKNREGKISLDNLTNQR